MSKQVYFLARTALCAVFAFALTPINLAQTNKSRTVPTKPVVAGAKVTQIDIEGLRELIKPKGKPLLINFWATWCEPCREEFPDLVKIDAEYKGKIDFITVSLDDLAEINGDVPKFLREVKAEMPAYLLKTADESAAIALVAKDWSGNLPMTVLYAPTGVASYTRMGKVTYEKLIPEIDKVFAAKPKAEPVSVPISQVSLTSQTVEVLAIAEPYYSYEKGVADAEKEITTGQFKILKYGLTPGSNSSPKFENLKKKYSLTNSESGCIVMGGFPEYANGFNKTMRTAFEKKFGRKAATQMGMSSENE